MKAININGKEYKLEYSIEASLYDECIEKVIDLVSRFGESTDGLDNFVKTISNVPKTVLTMFYAGLMENHSDEVKSIDDAKTLIKIYLKENDTTFFDTLTVILECMNDDGFFKQIGLEQIATQTKTPQDHKRKLKK